MHDKIIYDLDNTLPELQKLNCQAFTLSNTLVPYSVAGLLLECCAVARIRQGLVNPEAFISTIYIVDPCYAHS